MIYVTITYQLGTGLTTIAFVPQLLDKLSSKNTYVQITNIPSLVLMSMFIRKIPVLAAGGVTSGSQLAAVLALGADGACMGTTFLAAQESLYSKAQKQAIVNAYGMVT